MLAFTQEAQLLWLSQVSGAGVVTCEAGVAGVGVTLVVAEVGGGSDTAGVTDEFNSAENTHTTDRQMAAQSRQRENPDIVSYAVASRRKLQHIPRDVQQLSGLFGTMGPSGGPLISSRPRIILTPEI